MMGGEVEPALLNNHRCEEKPSFFEGPNTTWPLQTLSWSLTIPRFGNHSMILEDSSFAYRDLSLPRFFWELYHRSWEVLNTGTPKRR